MEQICIICVSGLPVPAVQGGAIETLVQSIIDQNEKEPSYQITLLCTYDKKAAEYYNRYEYTNFVAIKRNLWKDRVVFHGKKFLSGITHKPSSFVSYDKKIAVKYLIKNIEKFDLLINETGMEEYILGESKLPLKKRVYHLHGTSEFNLKNRRYANYLIAVSKFCANQWLEKGFDENNTFVLRNCVVQEKFDKKIGEEVKNEIRNKLGISCGDFVVMFAGRMIPQKGVKELIDAVSRLSNKNIVLILAGGVYYTARMRENTYLKELYVSASECASKVIFTGYIDNDELYKYLNIADIFVIPSRYNEAAGLVGIEAQTAGKFIIASNSGGIPEYICPDSCHFIKNDSLFVSSLVNEIKWCYEHRGEMKKLGQQGIEWASQFNEQAYFENFRSIIDDILNVQELEV